jgi:tRNA nucleotidyltransferase (CCA-adding enzyme)
MKGFNLFREDFGQNLLSDQPSLQIIKWQKAGWLKRYIPKLAKAAKIVQDPKFHSDTVFNHLVKTCDLVPRNIIMRWAGLLHDIGKVDTQGFHILCGMHWPKKKIINFCKIKQRRCYAKCSHAIPRVTFYRHELASVKTARIILRKFKVPQPSFDEAVKLISLHMFHYVRDWSDKAVLRFVQRSKITLEDLDNPDEFPLFRLRIADRLSRGLEPVTERQRDFERRLREYLSNK